MDSEVFFIVEESPEGGYQARSLGEAIFTQADDLAGLHENIRDAVRCHFAESHMPRMIRLHFVHEEILAV